MILQSEFSLFLHWIRERHNVWKKQQLGLSKPWTDDPIIRDNFFTSPYRELDKTTRWFRGEVRDPLWDNPAVLFATICFRWFNYIPTGEILTGRSCANKWNASPLNATPRRPNDGWPNTADLLVNWDPDEAKRRLRNQAKIFTGAFNISNSGSTKPKLDRVIDDYINPLWEACQGQLLQDFLDLSTRPSLQKAHKLLTPFLGMGGSGFMSYEVICDLRFTYLLDHADDVDTWCSMGPGAKRGLNRLLGNPATKTLPKLHLPLMRELLDRINRVLNTYLQNADRLTDIARLDRMPAFEMREVEHSLCEFDKYMRVLRKEGTSKRSYPGR